MSTKRKEPAGRARRLRSWRRQRPSGLAGHAMFDQRSDPLGFLQPAARDQPPRTLGDDPADQPHHDCARRSDQHHPAPAVEAERCARHQDPGGQRHDRNRRELHDLVDGEGPAAQMLGHQLADVGIDRDELHADPDAGERSPQQDTTGGRLTCHDERGRRIPEERIGEDCAPAKTVRRETEREGADEQSGEGRGDKRGQAGHAEERGRTTGEKAAAHQSRSDVSHQEEVVVFKRAAEREHQQQRPHIARRRQTVEPRLNQRRSLLRCELVGPA